MRQRLNYIKWVGKFMAKKNKEAKNYLDSIPVRNPEMEWKELDKKIVEVKVENKGFYNTLAQKLYKRPRFSYIKLDEYGSCVWKEIDGEKSIYEIGRILGEKHEGAANQLYERLSTYFRILERNKFIIFK